MVMMGVRTGQILERISRLLEVRDRTRAGPCPSEPPPGHSTPLSVSS